MPDFANPMTPSPLCDQLLLHVDAFSEGELSGEELAAIASQLRQGLARAQQQTLENLRQRAQGTDVSVQLEVFERSFDDMSQALESLILLANHPDDDVLEATRSLIVRAAHSSKLAMDLHQQAEFQEGPTEIPVLNLILRLRAAYLEQAVGRAEVTRAIDNLMQTSQTAIAELEKSARRTPPMVTLIEAYQRQNECLANYKAKLDQAAPLEEEALIASCHQVRQAMAGLNRAIMIEGPCRMERTNVFLNIASNYHQGKLPDEVFLDAIEGFYQELEAEQGRVERLASLPNDNELVQEQVELVRDAYEAHAQALEWFEEYVEGNSERYEAARERLVVASETLSDCKASLEQIADEAGKLTCVFCSATNDPTARICSRCGAQLPTPAGGDRSTVNYQEADGEASFGQDDFEMTENLVRLFEAVNAVAEGTMEDPDFEEILAWLDGLMLEARRGLPDVPDLLTNQDLKEADREQLAGLEEELTQKRGQIREAIDEFRDSLNLMAVFLDDHDKEHLMTGVVGIKEATQKMQRAERQIRQLAEAAQRKSN
ncbi:MAG: hypothetical protein AB7S38_30770 [Vulcanimicrobiota bacterium]